MKKSYIAATMMTVLLSAFIVEAQDAYRLTGRADAIIVDRDAHWQNWFLQNDRVTELSVRADSTSIFRFNNGVAPRFMRRNINAALDLEEFTYFDAVRTSELRTGAVTSRTNQALARNIADGDLSTYWEPAQTHFNNNGLREWEIEMDLGRLVHIDSVTLVFPRGQIGVEGVADTGDPFRSFAVFGSIGERSGERQGQTDSKVLAFDFLARGTDADLVRSADGQYLTFTIPLEPLDNADFDKDGAADMKGSMVHFFRIKVTDSALGRKRFIGDGAEAQAEYEALSTERQGDKIFQRVTAGGFLSPVSEGIYDTLLTAAQQGPIRYFTREVPRLMEVQIWGKGDNVAYQPETRAGGSLEQGGWCFSGSTSCNATDGALQTWWTANVWSQFVDRGTLWIDLGAVFWVDRTTLSMKWTTGRTIGSFMGNSFWFSDGTLISPVSMQSVRDLDQLEAGLQWDSVFPKLKFDNLDANVRMFEETFPMRKVRFIMARNSDPTGGEWEGAYVSPGNLGEIALYGEGYPVSVILSSPPILLNATSDLAAVKQTTLSKISWEGEALVQRPDPVTGELTEFAEPLASHPEVSLIIQTRTSEKTDTSFAYFLATEVSIKEVGQEEYNDSVFEWDIYNYVVANNLDTGDHRRSKDEDNDGQTNEDWFDGIDNDGDGLIDEDWTRVRPGRDIPKETPTRVAKLEFTGWSSWSAEYQPTNGVNEALVTSPSPRKFLQMRVTIASENPLKSARISGLRIDLVRPLSLQMAGEVALLTPIGAQRDLGESPIRDDYGPPINVDPLSPQEFSYFIRAAGPDPTQSQVINGFRQILILTREPAELIGVRTGTVEIDGDLVASTAFSKSYMRDISGVLRSSDGADSITVIPAGGDSMLLALPSSLNRGLSGNTHGIVEVRFRVSTVREGTQFQSYVRGDGDEFFQRVAIDNQDATDLVESSSAQIRLDNSFSGLVHNVTMVPYVTPNNDMVNDELEVSFTLLRVLEAVPVEVSFYDLGGRLVRRMQDLKDFAFVTIELEAGDVDTEGDLTGDEIVVPSFAGEAGQVEFKWDGRDDDGNLVAPGTYVMRILVDADRGDSEVLRTVSVAY